MFQTHLHARMPGIPYRMNPQTQRFAGWAHRASTPLVWLLVKKDTPTDIKHTELHLPQKSPPWRKIAMVFFLQQAMFAWSLLPINVSVFSGIFFVHSKQTLKKQRKFTGFQINTHCQMFCFITPFMIITWELPFHQRAPQAKTWTFERSWRLVPKKGIGLGPGMPLDRKKSNHHVKYLKCTFFATKVLVQHKSVSLCHVSTSWTYTWAPVSKTIKSRNQSLIWINPNPKISMTCLLWSFFCSFSDAQNV